MPDEQRVASVLKAEDREILNNLAPDLREAAVNLLCQAQDTANRNAETHQRRLDRRLEADILLERAGLLSSTAIALITIGTATYVSNITDSNHPFLVAVPFVASLLGLPVGVRLWLRRQRQELGQVEAAEERPPARASASSSTLGARSRYEEPRQQRPAPTKGRGRGR